MPLPAVNPKMSHTFHQVKHFQTRHMCFTTQRDTLRSCSYRKMQERGKSRSCDFEAGSTPLNWQRFGVVRSMFLWHSAPPKNFNTLMLTDSSVKHSQYHTTSYNSNQSGRLNRKVSPRPWASRLSVLTCGLSKLGSCFGFGHVWDDTCPHIRHPTLLIFLFYFFCVFRSKKMNRCCVCLEMLWAVPRL